VEERDRRMMEVDMRRSWVEETSGLHGNQLMGWHMREGQLRNTNNEERRRRGR